jgi:hypothetical protein
MELKPFCVQFRTDEANPRCIHPLFFGEEVRARA